MAVVASILVTGHVLHDRNLSFIGNVGEAVIAMWLYARLAVWHDHLRSGASKLRQTTVLRAGFFTVVVLSMASVFAVETFVASSVSSAFDRAAKLPPASCPAPSVNETVKLPVKPVSLNRAK
jgi:hypothetical protein